MNNKIKEIIKSEAKELGISSSEFGQYVESGLRILLGNRSYVRLEKLMEQALIYDMLEEIILASAYGGLIEANLSNDRN